MMNIFIPEVPILEKIVRPMVVYVFIFLAFRFLGKRQVGQLSPSDLIVLLIISNVVQNAMIGPDNSLTGGLIGALTIFGLNYLLVEIDFRSKKARHLLEAQPTLLIHNGRVIHESLNRERVTLDELLAALRRQGLIEPSQVRYAILEEAGSISVIPK